MSRPRGDGILIRPSDEEVPLRTFLVVAFFALVVAALEVAGAHHPVYGLWGVHHYGFLPAWWLGIGGGGAVLLFLVSWRWGTGQGKRGRVLLGLVLVAGAALFVLGRERFHFLGDGQGRISGILQGQSSWPLEPLGALVATRLYRLLPFEDPAVAFAILSVACGLLYLGFAVRLARDVSRDGGSAFLVFGLLALAGLTRLFYGYVETYPLLVAAATVYLVLAVRLLRGRGHPAVIAAVWSVVFLVHSIAFVLLPSLVFALLVDARRRGGLRRALPVLAIPVLALIVDEAVLRRAGVSLAAVARTYASGVLPLSGGTTSQAPYGLLSGGHFLDVFQRDLLLGPFAGVFAILLLVSRGAGRLPSEERFLLWAGVPWWAVSFLLNPVLGEPRLWGLHAAGAVPFLMLIGLVLARSPLRVERPRLVGASAGLLLGITFFHTLPWIALGTDVDRSLGEVVGLYGPASRAAPQARALTFDALGSWYLSHRETDNAEVAFTEAANADTTSTFAAEHLANLWLATGRTGQAVDLLTWAVGQTPDRESLHFNLGNAYLTLGLSDSAAVAYREALKRNPDFLQAYVRLSGILLNQGKIADAESTLTAAERRFPDDPTIQGNLGRVAQEKGDTLAALNLYRTALERNPQDADTAFNLGLLLMDRRKWGEAAGYFRLVVDRRPRDAEGWVNLGVCLERQADTQGALSAYRQAFAIAPGRPEAAMNLVRLQVAGKDTAGATATLREYAARDSTSRYGDVARELLRALGSGLRR